MENIQIRSLQQTDVEALLSFMNTISQERTFIRLQGEPITLDIEIRYVDDYVRKIAEHTAVKLLAWNGTELVGVADICLRDKIERHIGVFGITVKKEWRGKGLGKRLMEETIKEGIRNITGLKIIELGVFANNPIAKKMYEKMGFVEYGRLPKGIQYKGELIDHIYMYKQV